MLVIWKFHGGNGPPSSIPRHALQSRYGSWTSLKLKSTLLWNKRFLGEGFKVHHLETEFDIPDSLLSVGHKMKHAAARSGVLSGIRLIQFWNDPSRGS